MTIQESIAAILIYISNHVFEYFESYYHICDGSGHKMVCNCHLSDVPIVLLFFCDNVRTYDWKQALALLLFYNVLLSRRLLVYSLNCLFRNNCYGLPYNYLGKIIPQRHKESEYRSYKSSQRTRCTWPSKRAASCNTSDNS